MARVQTPGEECCLRTASAHDFFFFFLNLIQSFPTTHQSCSTQIVHLLGQCKNNVICQVTFDTNFFFIQHLVAFVYFTVGNSCILQNKTLKLDRMPEKQISWPASVILTLFQPVNHPSLGCSLHLSSQPMAFLLLVFVQHQGQVSLFQQDLYTQVRMLATVQQLLHETSVQGKSFCSVWCREAGGYELKSWTQKSSKSYRRFLQKCLACIHMLTRRVKMWPLTEVSVPVETSVQMDL